MKKLPMNGEDQLADSKKLFSYEKKATIVIQDVSALAKKNRRCDGASNTFKLKCE